MKGENDPMLESDRLEELLEEPVAAQPVVVVQYRSRGVPSWVFFPLIFVVPLAAIVVYHRMVVERYRVQAAQANSLLVREISVDRASLPLVRNDPPPTTLLPVPQAPAAPIVADDPRPATTTGLAGPQGPMSSPEADPFLTLADSPTTTGAPPAPASTNHPVGAGAVPPAVTTEVSAAAPEKPAKITIRSVLPNPFAEGASAPRPPTPAEGAGSAPDVDNRVKSPTAPAQDLVGQAAKAGTGVKNPQAAVEKPPAGAVAAVVGPAVAAQPLAPLPTKEEAEREIQEEAARRAAEIRAQTDAKSAETRATRLTEQLKFRDELGELIRLQGKKAGPDIEALAKRFGYEYDPDRMTQAIRIWRLTRKSQAEKVRGVRALELPESVVLGFLFDDIFRTAMGRNGPRNDGEVRVLAAQQLLRYPLTKSTAAKPPARSVSASVPAARSSPSRKTVVSTPR